MPAKRYRTAALKLRMVKVPGGRTVARYRRGKVGVARCAACGRPLGGVPKLRPSELRALAKSSRRPSRPYGGNLCPACARRTVIEAVRG